MKIQKVSLTLILVFVIILGSTVSFAAEGDLYLKADGSMKYSSNQMRTDRSAKNHARTKSQDFLIEVSGVKHGLAEANAAYILDPVNWKKLLKTDVDELKIISIDGLVDKITNHDNWIEFKSINNVSLNKEWNIEFSRSVELDDIYNINIINKNQYISIKEIKPIKDKREIVISPKVEYSPNQRYTIQIIFKNGLKYKMDFITKSIDEVNPNNNVLNASKIMLTDAEKGFTIEKYIESDTEEYYFIDITNSGELDIEVNRYDYANINLHFCIVDYNNQEKELIRIGSKEVDWGGNTNSKRIMILDVEPGRYYIKLSGNYRDDHINQKGQSGNYRLDVKYLKTYIQEDLELNDIIYDAIPIEFNKPKTGQIMYIRKDGSRDKADYYKFTVLKRGEIDISVERYDLYNVNLYLSRLDKMNKEKILFSHESTVTNNNINSVNVNPKMSFY